MAKKREEIASIASTGYQDPEMIFRNQELMDRNKDLAFNYDIIRPQVETVKTVRIELPMKDGSTSTIQALPGSEVALESWLKQLERYGSAA